MKFTFLLLISACFLLSCQQDTNQITYSKSIICKEADSLMIFANYPERPVDKTWGAKAEALLAKKTGDTIKIDFAGGIMTGFSLEVNIINDHFFGILENYSCTYHERLKIRLKEFILEEKNYNVDDTIRGRIDLIATYENEAFSSGEVFINGCFTIRLRDENFTYEDLNYEKRLEKFKELLKNPSEVKGFLSLRALRLYTLPEEIKLFQYVDSIDLSYNYLTNADFEKLTALQYIKYLDLSSNKITVMPKDINKLNNLEYLDITGNLIEFLPNEFFELQQLKNLSITLHNSPAFPKQINKLKNLEYLSISGETIKTIPDELTLLPKLETLLVPDSLEYLPVDLIDKMRYLYDVKLDFPLLKNREKVMKRIAKLPPPVY